MKKEISKSPHLRDERYEFGITPILLLLTIAASSVAVFGGGLLAKDKGLLNFTGTGTSKLLSVQSSYLDKDKINKSTIDGSVIGTVLLPNGSFSAYKMLNGEVVNEGKEFSGGEIKVAFLSGDIGLGSYENGNISPFYLKDGTTTTGVIIDRMLVDFKDENYVSHPIKILQGKVIDGKITGDFVGQTLDTGYYVAGTIDNAGRVSGSNVVSGAPKLSEAQTVVATNALSLFKDITFVFDGLNTRVLGTSTENSAGNNSNSFNKPVYNTNSGTWTFAEGSANGTLSTSPVQNVINYVQGIAQSLSTGTPIQTIASTVEGIKELRSTNSRLSVSTSNNVATVSLDLSNITASVADGAISTAKVADGAITSDKISDGTITSSDLSSSLLASIGSGGDITAVIAGNGLTGGATSGDATLSINLPTTGSSSATSSNSGLESSSAGLSLLRGCGNGQILKWNSTTNVWYCAADSGGGGGSADVMEGGTVVTSGATALNFNGDQFSVSESPTGQANLSLDFTNSKVVRSNQNESISGNWTFANGLVLGTDTVSDITGSGLSVSGGVLNVGGLTASNFASGNISQWTNDAGYLTGNQSISLTGDISGTGATSISTTIGNGAVSLSKMANLAANSIIGNNTGSPATPVALTASQVKTLLGLSTSDVSGLGTMATESAGNIFVTGGQLNNVTVGGIASGLSIAAGSNTISGITASNLTAGDFSSKINSGTYSINISGNAATATTATSATTAGSAISATTATTATTANALANSDAAGQSAITAINSASTGTINAARIAALPYISTILNSGNILVGNGSNVAAGVTMSGDVSIDNTGATTIGNSKVTLGKIVNIANNTILGNNSGSAGAPSALTASQIKTILGISTSDVSGLGTMATQSAGNIFVTGGQMSGLSTVNGATISGGSLSNTSVNGVTTANIVLTSGSYSNPSWISGLTANHLTAGDFSSKINSGT